MKSFPKSAFSLVELVVALAIMAVLIGLMLPRFLELRQGALVKVCYQQAEQIQKALNCWASNAGDQVGSSVLDISNDFGSSDFLTSTSTWDEICKYMDTNFVDRLSFESNGAITTSEMEEVSGTPQASSVMFAGTSYSAAATGDEHAYVRIFWPADSQLRYQTSPVVVLYLPDTQ